MKITSLQNQDIPLNCSTRRVRTRAYLESVKQHGAGFRVIYPAQRENGKCTLKQVSVTPHDWPKGWFDEGSGPFADTLQGIFVHDGRPAMFLFWRFSDQGFVKYLAPLVASPRGEVSIISDCSYSGLFKPKYRITIKSIAGEITVLEVPYARLAKGYEDSAHQFLARAKSVYALLDRMGIPEFMFTPFNFERAYRSEKRS